jgi:molybdenum cofactor cytidylyltransferase
MRSTEIGIVLLAAGASSRMGEPKQLLHFEGKTFLEKAIESAVQSDAEHVVVVLGANEKAILRKLNISQYHVVSNPNWEKGMSESLKVGLEFLLKKTELDAVLVLLVDQPHVNASLINQLIEAFLMKDKGIVACKYGSTIGVPCLFDKKYFPEIFALKEQQGAKKIIYQYLDETSLIDFPMGAIDIDTQEDYQELLRDSND